MEANLVIYMNVYGCKTKWYTIIANWVNVPSKPSQISALYYKHGADVHVCHPSVLAFAGFAFSQVETFLVRLKASLYKLNLRGPHWLEVKGRGNLEIISHVHVSLQCYWTLFKICNLRPLMHSPLNFRVHARHEPGLYHRSHPRVETESLFKEHPASPGYIVRYVISSVIFACTYAHTHAAILI